MGTLIEPLVRKVPGIAAYVHSFDAGETPRHEHVRPRMSFLLAGNTVEEDHRMRKTECNPFALVTQPVGYTHAHCGRTPTTTLCVDFYSEFSDRDPRVAAALEQPSIVCEGPVVDVCLRIHREMWSRDDVSDLVMEGLFVELLGELARTGVPRESSAPPWLRVVRELLHDRYSENLTLDSIGQEVGVHPNHLGRTFRAHYGKTVGEYVRQLRLNHALRQVASSGRSIGEIAIEAGFCDHAYFTRECRKSLGITPLEFRRSIRRA